MKRQRLYIIIINMYKTLLYLPVTLICSSHTLQFISCKQLCANVASILTIIVLDKTDRSRRLGNDSVGLLMQRAYCGSCKRVSAVPHNTYSVCRQRESFVVSITTERAIHCTRHHYFLYVRKRRHRINKYLYVVRSKSVTTYFPTLPLQRFD